MSVALIALIVGYVVLGGLILWGVFSAAFMLIDSRGRVFWFPICWARGHVLDPIHPPPHQCVRCRKWFYDPT